MYPTLLDLETGLTHTLPEHDANVFQWCENNHSCDCNRRLFVSQHLKLEGAEQVRMEGDDRCTSERLVMVDAHGNLEGQTVDALIEQANHGYPASAQAVARAWRGIRQEQAELRAIIETAPEGSMPRRSSIRL